MSQNLVIVRHDIELPNIIITFWCVKCSKCGKILACYADYELALYHAQNWLRCCK